MAKRIVSKSSLTSVADAIRDKCETTSELVFPEGFVSAIGSIVKDGGGITPVGTINITTNGEHDVTNFASANVNVPTGSAAPVLRSANVTPSAEQQIVTPGNGYDGLSQVTVAGDADLVAGNIKRGVNIFNVTGTYEGSAAGSEIEVDNLSELHSWTKYAIGGTVTETKVDTLYIAGDQTGLDSLYEPVDYADDYTISNGGIVLVNPTENVTLTSSSAAQVILGKYIQTYTQTSQYATSSTPSGIYYRIDSTADIEPY